MFGAMLRAWRARRGLSQLDLALAAEVSARHVSFLETGRARPSDEMVQRLASVLGLGLRDHNDLLVAAGHPRRFREARAISELVHGALTRMLAQHDPYPLVVLDGGYEVLRASAGAERMFGAILGRVPAEPNLLELLFDPRALRPHVVDWDSVAERLLARLRREQLASPGDARLARLLDRVLAFADVPRFAFDPSMRAEAVVPLRFRHASHTLSFVTTATTFAAPDDVAVSELRIESLFPLDEPTRLFFEAP